MIITRSPLRISFLGGGTDLPQYYEQSEMGQVLSFAFNKYIYIAAHPLVEDASYLIKYSKQEYVDSVEKIEHPAVREILRIFPQKGIDISITSDIPSGTGLGSSSSFAVGLIHLITSYTKQQLTKYELAKLACEIEISLLKQPIGKQDQFAAAMGGINHFKFFADGNVEIESLNSQPNVIDFINSCTLLIRSPGSRSASSKLNEQVKLLTDVQLKSSMLRQYDLMKELVPQGKIAIQQHDTKLLGNLINESWKIKKTFEKNITNLQVNQKIAEVLKCGATGAKLLGAGGSGYILAVGEPDSLEKISETFQGTFIKPRVDISGAEVIYNSD